MAYDSDRHVALLFGGIAVSNGASLADTWEYNGADWRSAPAGPPPRWGHGLAYDAVRHRAVIFSGQDSSSALLNDTWEYDGTAWSLRNLIGTNLERHDGAMAFDPVRGQVLRFGGYAGSGETGDTWAWDGTQWLQLPAAGPSARYLHAMATDTVRNQIVLFGGHGPVGSSGVNFNDTWLWNGSAWQQAFPATVPPFHTGHSMAFDAVTAKTILNGGSSGGVDTDTWAWDGSNWSLRPVATPPPSSNQAPMTYDQSRDRVVFLANNDQTWEYHAPVNTPASWSLLGSGCPATGGVPGLDAVLGSLPFAGAPFRLQLVRLGQQPFLLAFGVIGYSATAWGNLPLPLDLGTFGLPGCTAYTEAFAYVTLTRSGDHADWTISIPAWQQLVGTDFWLQGFVFDGGAPHGAAVSNAGHGHIGLR
jgi:hypothetical protein